ncbi:hypothetical protein NSU10_27590 [Bacillus sp. FSL E2-8895]|uniref:hypothetical protein n=1 Tax=Bacillus sp. FSL E2-8895 TaxID=2954600 RepID=UPI0030F5B6EE
MENNYLPVPTWEQYEKAKSNGINKNNVDQRIIRGWNILRAITWPVKESFTKKYKKELETAHFVEVNELSVSERGVGGFGLTGMK